MLDGFYQTVAQLCFTLLGLWWLVLQTKYRVWVSDAKRRRMATNISLYFLLPGAMSLLALLATDPLFWQIPFILTGAIGALETFFLILRSPHPAGTPWIGPALRWTGFVLYVLVVLVAVVALFANQLQITLSHAFAPLVVAGWLLTLLIVLGLGLAWAYFIEPAEDMSDAS
jgi:hypothetical protein